MWKFKTSLWITNHNLLSWNLNRLTEAIIKHIKLGKSKGAGSSEGFVIGGDENRLHDNVNQKKKKNQGHKQTNYHCKDSKEVKEN